MLGAPFGGDVLDVERARAEVIAEETRAGLVLLARRVDGRNPDQIRGELDDLVGRAIDLGQHALDGLHATAVYNIAIMNVPAIVIDTCRVATGDWQPDLVVARPHVMHRA